MVDLEDLFEEMNGKAEQSNGSYFLFPSKITLCVLAGKQSASHGMILLIVNGNFNVFSSGRKEYLCRISLNTWEFKHQVYLVV